MDCCENSLYFYYLHKLVDIPPHENFSCTHSADIPRIRSRFWIAHVIESTKATTSSFGKRIKSSLSLISGSHQTSLAITTIHVASHSTAVSPSPSCKEGTTRISELGYISLMRTSRETKPRKLIVKGMFLAISWSLGDSGPSQKISTTMSVLNNSFFGLSDNIRRASRRIWHHFNCTNLPTKIVLIGDFLAPGSDDFGGYGGSVTQG